MTEVETIINEPSEAEKRIKSLSDKVRTTAEERDALAQQKADAEAKAQEAEKKAAFAESFSDIVAMNPAAKEYRADIQAKVMQGLSAEEAMYAVLGKAGKLNAPKEPEGPVAGGSATTNVQPKVQSPNEMTQDERRKILTDALGFN